MINSTPCSIASSTTSSSTSRAIITFVTGLFKLPDMQTDWISFHCILLWGELFKHLNDLVTIHCLQPLSTSSITEIWDLFHCASFLSPLLPLASNCSMILSKCFFSSCHFFMKISLNCSIKNGPN